MTGHQHQAGGAIGGNHVGIARLPPGDALFAKELTGLQAGDQLAPTLGVLADDLHVAGEQQVQCGGGFALFDDRKSGWKPSDLTVVVDVPEC